MHKHILESLLISTRLSTIHKKISEPFLVVDTRPSGMQNTFENNLLSIPGFSSFLNTFAKHLLSVPGQSIVLMSLLEHSHRRRHLKSSPQRPTHYADCASMLTPLPQLPLHLPGILKIVRNYLFASKQERNIVRICLQQLPLRSFHDCVALGVRFMSPGSNFKQ